MNMKRLALCGSVLSIGFAVGSCGPEHHARKVQSGLEGDRLSVGTVQREIHRGMSGADVIAALGSPNVVTTDEGGREVWVYDKFATDVVSSGSHGGAWRDGGVAYETAAASLLEAARGKSGVARVAAR